LGIVALTFIIATKDVDISFLHRFDTWRARIEKFVSNEEIAASKFDTDKDGQVAHARIAVATSHVIGKGPGNSVQRDFLSQAFSDFIFAIVIEELGLLGGAFVVFLYICLLIRVGRIAKRCNRSFPAFLVIGIGLLLVTQAVFNMMVAVGLAPVTGQPLPLISRGGTSTIINCVYIGMLLSVSRYTASIEQEELLRQAEVAPEKSAAVLLAEAVLAENQAQSAEEPTSKVLNSDSEFE
jgi:cell division protein FtsW